MVTQTKANMKRLFGKGQLQATDIYLTRSDRIFHVINNIIVSLLFLIVLLPLINVLASSFSSASAVNSGKVLLWPVDFSVIG